MTKEQYVEYCNGCKNTLGYAPTPNGQFQNCVCCQTPEENWPKGARIPLRNCSIRLCVMKTGAENCAYCSRFPCAYIADRADEWSRENVEKKYGKTFSEKDFKTYILPFERFSRLEKIHATLTPNQLVKVKTVPPYKAKIVAFPENLELSKDDVKSLRKLHELLSKISSSTLNMKDTDVYAQQERLKGRIKHFQRFLWIIGTFAQKNVQSDSLLIDAKSYVKNRRSESWLGNHSFLINYLTGIFKEFGIIIEALPLTEVMKGKKGWTTPTGALRDRNWQMRVSCTDEIGCIETLKMLQRFCEKLDTKYSKKSFGFFNKADMRVFQN